MKTLHLPKLPHLTKHLLIILGIAVVVLLVLVGAATAAHEKHVADTQAAHDAAVQAADQKRTQDVINTLRTDNANLSAAHATLCTYVNSLIQAPHTKGYITVPTAAGCPNPKQ